MEKGSDGLYSIYSEDHFGNIYFGGFGKTVEVAKKDFLESIVMISRPSLIALTSSMSANSLNM